MNHSKPQTSKVALVTGGAKRVGQAIVLELASSGYDIAFTYNGSQKEAATTHTAIQKLNRKSLLIQADLTNPAEVQTVITQFKKNYSRLDLLVNNASTFTPGRLADVTPQNIWPVFQLHFAAPLLLTQGLAPLLKKTKGHIVNMIDLLAAKPWPQYLAYSASKAALASLTQSLARELAPHVTVNGIAPGVVEWPKDYPPAEKKKYLAKVPLARSGTPKNVAALVKFLAQGGDYITGQIINLDGGRSIS